ncbi:MAG: efflux transporter periplasmic adaptor subunit, partial [Campylobacter sp.]|nr:efflux transporter periplasmic adaptor subunit [Campylobacter sp.]
MRKFKKKPLIIVAIIVLAGVLYWTFSSNSEEQNQLITSKIKKANLILSVDAVGEVFAENLVDVGTRAT